MNDIIENIIKGKIYSMLTPFIIILVLPAFAFWFNVHLIFCVFNLPFNNPIGFYENATLKDIIIFYLTFLLINFILYYLIRIYYKRKYLKEQTIKNLNDPEELESEEDSAWEDETDELEFEEDWEDDTDEPESKEDAAKRFAWEKAFSPAVLWIIGIHGVSILNCIVCLVLEINGYL